MYILRKAFTIDDGVGISNTYLINMIALKGKYCFMNYKFKFICEKVRLTDFMHYILNYKKNRDFTTHSQRYFWHTLIVSLAHKPNQLHRKLIRSYEPTNNLKINKIIYIYIGLTLQCIEIIIWEVRQFVFVTWGDIWGPNF